MIDYSEMTILELLTEIEITDEWLRHSWNKEDKEEDEEDDVA